MKTINNHTTYLMGHTRWPTIGSIHNLDNDHPLVAPVDGGDHVLVTRNGSISNSESHFKRLGLPRTAQVDSELLLRIAQRHSDSEGLHIDKFISYLPELHGRMSMATVVTSKPNEIILLKGNMPLEVRYNPKYKIIVYASEPGILSNSLINNLWRHIPMSISEGLVIDSYSLSIIKQFEFTFDRINSK
ncbi:MAG: class II glutamine amidotransferase domain-containing protein [Armatimonadota bacterium]